MRLFTLGGLRLEPAHFQRPKPLLLLAYLAVEGARDRRHLSTLFWPEAAEPATSLRVALGQVRQAVPEAVVLQGDRVGLGIESDVGVLLTALRTQDPDDLLGLYSGPFLEGLSPSGLGPELEEWVYATREVLGAQVRARLVTLAEREARAGQLMGAARLAEGAYRLPGAPELEGEELGRLYRLLLSGDSPLAEMARRALERCASESHDGWNGGGQDSRERPAQVTPHNLPAARTSFVGREQERRELRQVLCGDEARLVTLLGPGGIGKTRLALEVAGELRHQDPGWNGVHFVALDPLTAPEQLPLALARALDLPVGGREDPLPAVLRAIGNSRRLLVLDNFEHLIAGALLVPELLSCCPNLRLLVTSREHLGLQEEFVLPVQGLSLPPADPLTLPELSRYDGPQLFLQRARRARLGYAPAQTDIPHILAICRLVEGSPLGIELAAAWVRMMPTADLAREIGRNLDLLERAARNVPGRHQSLRAVFEHSWALLGPREQAVLCRLAVFRGGFEREAAAEVAGATLPGLASLVDKSLLRVGADGRYDVHFLLQQYLREKLAAQPGVLATAQEKHAHFFLALAETAAPQLSGPEEAPWLARLAREHDNLRAALGWLEASGEGESGLRLAAALRGFWLIHGHAREGREWLERFLIWEAAGTARAAPAVRAQALTGAAWLAHAMDDFTAASRMFEESAALRLSLGQTEGVVTRLVNEAMQARGQGEYPRATALLRESLALHRAGGNRQSISQDGLGLSLSRLGLVLCEQGEYSAAAALLEENLALHRVLNDRGGVAASLLSLSDVAREQGDVARVQALAGESLALFRDLGERWGIGFALNNLAVAASVAGDLAGAAALIQESVDLLRTVWGKAPAAEALATAGAIHLARNELQNAHQALAESLTTCWAHGPRWLVAVNLDTLAGLAVSEGEPQRAARLLGAAQGLRAALGLPLSPARRVSRDRFSEAAQHLLKAEVETFRRAWEEGGALPLEQVVREAAGTGRDLQPLRDP